MHKILFYGFIFIVCKTYGVSYVWNGTTDNNWGTITNWTPNGIPDVGDDVTINDGGALNQPLLDGARTISNLSVSAGSLDLNTYTLTVSSITTITGGTLSNGGITSPDFNTVQNASFTGTITLIKSPGGDADVWQGNNAFVNLVLTNQDNDNINIGNAFANTISGTSQFNVTGAGQIRIAEIGNNIFTGNVTLTCSGSGGVKLGSEAPTNGNLTVSSGFINIASGTFTNGILYFYNVTQSNTGGAIVASVSSFIMQGSTVRGDYTITSSAAIIVEGSTITEDVELIKNGGVADRWTVGNTFGTLKVTNNSTSVISLAEGTGNIISGPSEFHVTSSGEIDVFISGTNTFAGNVTISSIGSGGIHFGANIDPTQELNITSGGIIALPGTFIDGPLYIYDVTQTATAGAVTASATDFYVENSILRGDYTITSSDVIFIEGSTITGDVELTKNGGVDDRWSVGNTFGTLKVTNNSTSAMSLAEGTGNTINGPSEFHVTSSGEIDVFTSGTNTFAGNVTISSTGSGGIHFGGNIVPTQALNITSGGIIALPGTFLDGSLYIYDVTQTATAGAVTASTNGFYVENSILRGDYTITSSGAIYIEGSTITGDVELTKNGGGFDQWTVENTFGTLKVTNNSTSGMSLSEGNGNTINGASEFHVTNDGEIAVFISGSNTFAGNVTISSTGAGGIHLGANIDPTQELDITSGGIIALPGTFIDGPLYIYDVNQSATAGSVSASPSDFHVENSVLRGDYTIATNDIEIKNSSMLGTNSITKNGGVDNDCFGNNIFGNLTLTNNDVSRIRFANNQPDTYNGNATFVQASTGAVEPAYNGNNNFSGNISTVGSTSVITFGSGSGRVIINGNTIQTINASASFEPIISRLSMSTSGSLNLNVPLSISNDLAFTNGIINSTSTNLMILLSGAGHFGASSSSHVDGPIRKIGNTTFTFPVGDNGEYAPIVISAPSDASHYFTASYYHSDPHLASYDVTSKDPTLDHIGRGEYWILDRNPGMSSDVNVTLSWDTRSGVVDDMPNLVVARWNGTSWVDHGHGGTPGTNSAGTVETSSPVTSFCPFTIASRSPDNPLPIELLNFYAEAEVSYNNIKWKTLTEVNNEFFTVYKSNDGINFESFTKTLGAGNSSIPNDYSIVDDNPYAFTYYKLRQTDFDGKYTESKIISATRKKSDKNSVICNVSNNNVNIIFENQVFENASVNIINALGVQVQSVINFPTQNGEYSFPLNNLSGGLYYILINFDSEVSSFPLLIVK